MTSWCADDVYHLYSNNLVHYVSLLAQGSLKIDLLVHCGINNYKKQLVALTVIEFCLSKGIKQSVKNSIEKLKIIFHSVANFLRECRVYLQ